MLRITKTIDSHKVLSKTKMFRLVCDRRSNGMHIHKRSIDCYLGRNWLLPICRRIKWKNKEKKNLKSNRYIHFGPEIYWCGDTLNSCDGFYGSFFFYLLSIFFIVKGEVAMTFWWFSFFFLFWFGILLILFFEDHIWYQWNFSNKSLIWGFLW